MTSQIYPKELAKFVKEYHLIPKKIKFIEDIRQYGKYISLQQSNIDGFKVEEIIEVNDLIYYQIRFLISGRQAVVPYEPKFTYYELYKDKSKITKLPNIINTEYPYYGSEIKYWFFINNIDLDSKKYNCFKSYICKSDYTLSDKKLYYLTATYLPLTDEYVNSKALLYKNTV